MKIYINNEELFTLSDIQKKVIQNDIPLDIFEDDMKRRLKHIIEHSTNQVIEQNFKSFREFIKSKNISSMPSDKMEFAALIFQHAPVELSEIESQKHIIKVDDQDFFEISDVTKKLLKSSIAKDCDCIEWAKERLQWVLNHKYERCMERLRKEWEPRLLKEGVKEFPVDDDAFAELVFKNPEYKNRSQRDKESNLVLNNQS